MRVDFSIECRDTTGGITPEYAGILLFTVVMLVVHTIGTPATYAYLFFVKHRKELVNLQNDELVELRKSQLEANPNMTKEELAALGELCVDPYDEDGKERVLLRRGSSKLLDIGRKRTLPGYLRKLTAGYDSRRYWFEIFECLRKVLLVGVPATFPGRGGNAQLVWGLMVCFLTFGAYMMYAPFVKSSDDQLSQLAQTQIFLTLVASIGLRMTPPDESLGTLVSVTLFILPVFAIGMETPLVEELRKCCACLKQLHKRGSRGKVLPAKVEPARIDQASAASGVATGAEETEAVTEVEDVE